MDEIEIRVARESDKDAIWEIFRTVVSSGDTYVFEPAITKEAALAYWFSPGNETFVVSIDRQIAGTYILRPNQPGLGSHVANAAFMVGKGERRRGLGRLMGEHAIDTARKGGYRAMQFNFVVSSNEKAIELWKKLGFEIVGTLPQAFRHLELGYIDAYVMYRNFV